MSEIIDVSVDAEGIATLLIDRRDNPVNVIDQKFMDELSAAIEQVAGTAAIRAPSSPPASRSSLRGPT